MRIASIVGARPEFVQTAVLSHVLRGRHDELLIHTGQHYDTRMSDRFFAELGIPEPAIDLGVGSLPPPAQTGEIMRGLAAAIGQADVDLVLVRGDTTSTLAGALVAKQLLLPLVHVEAGMRSYDRTMPEEINRIVADHISDVLLVTDRAAAARLAGEGIERGVFVVGDVMYDLFLQSADRPVTLPPALAALEPGGYDLLTVHRAENTDVAARLRSIVAGFTHSPRPVVFPVHPRTRARLDASSISLPGAILPVEPLGYLEIATLERRARAIFTDSGGVQREAYFAGTPCITLRDTTEWTNTVEAGWNVLAGAETARIAAAVRRTPSVPAERPPLFGDGHAAEAIVAALESPEVAALVARARAVRQARG